MIQRKQTIFLFFSAVALGLLFYFPLASFIGGQDSVMLYIHKVVSLVPDHHPDLPVYFNLPLLTLDVLLLLLTITSIFLFKNRKRQLGVVRVNIILLLAMIAVFFFYEVPVLEKLSDGLADYDTGAYFPLIAFLFYVLAYRGIMSDEKLIRSADRLR